MIKFPLPGQFTGLANILIRSVAEPSSISPPFDTVLTIRR